MQLTVMPSRAQELPSERVRLTMPPLAAAYGAAVDGRDHDDAAVLIGLHGLAHDLAAGEELPVEVGVDDVEPVLVRERGRVAAARNTSGIDQNVDLAKMRDDVADAVRDALGILQIHVMRIDLDAVFRLDLPGVFIQTIGAAGDERDVCARVGHCLGELKAETGGTAAAERDLAGKIKQIVFHNKAFLL